MTDTVAELVERSRALSPEDRSRLVELLLETLPDASDASIERAWNTETRRRVSAYERGEAILFDADEVIAEATRLTQ